MAKDFHFSLDRFLGLSDSLDDSSALPLGASRDMLNLKVTQGGQLQKREGYAAVYAAGAVLRGVWTGEVAGEERFAVVIGNQLFASKNGFEHLFMVPGEVPGEERIHFVSFYDGLYLLTGNGIRRYDGQKVSEITPHIPLVMISTSPDGAGTMFEEPNLLTQKIRQRFSPDGVSTDFTPVITSLAGVQQVTLNETVISPDQYSWDGEKGKLVMKTAPEKGIDTMEVVMEMQGESASDRIFNCRFAVSFGGANDTRVFLYGNRDTPAVRYHSGVVDGKPSFSYFPELGYSLVGTGAPITSILRHYDRQLIFTENAAYYSYLEYITGEGGKLVAAFPILPLSDDRGCAPQGQALLMDNSPITLTDAGLFRWISTNIRDERNAQCFSDPIARALQKEKASDAVLFHRKATSELFVCFGDRVYVYNGKLDLFYYYELPEVKGFYEVGTDLYFYTEKVVFRVEGTLDEGREIPAHWESGTLDFSDAAKEKNLFGFTLLGEAEGKVETEMVFSEENGEQSARITLDLPEGKELSTGFVRLPMRRVHLLKIRLSTVGDTPFRLRGIRLSGRITKT